MNVPKCKQGNENGAELIAQPGKFMKINKYLPFAFIYFFINSLGLPFGMLYTILLTPVFYFWLLTKGKKRIVLKFLIVSSPFLVNHLINGVDLFYFVRSVLLYCTVYIFSYAFYTLITTYKDMEVIYRKLAIANFVLTIVALLFVFTDNKALFWGNWSISTGGVAIENLPRLNMFTYEPSLYSTLLVPIFAFYFIKVALGQSERNTLSIMIMIALSLMLSFSMGVIAGFIVAISLLFVANLSRFARSKKLLYSFSTVALIFVVGLIFLVLFYRDNPFFVRIMAIIAGQDGSANGRTYEAFQLAYSIAKLKSIWWGIGPGQLKILGADIINSFYNYPADYGQVNVPNTVAETLALFGIIGTCVRFFVEVYLFFKTKVLDNYYRTLLFFFIFIYQFTGSFTTNIAEYVIWILAFSNTFPEFDRKPNQGTRESINKGS